MGTGDSIPVFSGFQVTGDSFRNESTSPGGQPQFIANGKYPGSYDNEHAKLLKSKTAKTDAVSIVNNFSAFDVNAKRESRTNPEQMSFGMNS